jgi:hypothetical protein
VRRSDAQLAWESLIAFCGASQMRSQKMHLLVAAQLLWIIDSMCDGVASKNHFFNKDFARCRVRSKSQCFSTLVIYHDKERQRHSKAAQGKAWEAERSRLIVLNPAHDAH